MGLLPVLGLVTVVATGSALLARYAATRMNAAHAAESGDAPAQRWLGERVVVTLDESLESLGPDARAALLSAFDAWHATGAPLPRVEFVTGRGAQPSLTPDGRNSVLIAPIEFEGHETDLAITIGFSHPKTGEITEADIVINARHVFAVVPEPAEGSEGDALASADRPTNPELRPLSCLGTSDGAACGQTYDLQNVLTHEVGHFWGLPEDFEDRSSTMYSCTSACEVHKRRLAAGDVQALHALYGHAPEATCQGAPIARAQRPSTGSAAFALGLGLGGLWWGQRRRRRNARPAPMAPPGSGAPRAGAPTLDGSLGEVSQPGTSTSAPSGGSFKSND